MAPIKITDKLYSWADDLDPKTTHQAAETAKLPIIAGHVALMPDAHMGYGCAVGSVVPTAGSIIPSAVGVDIGCGMAAVKTDLVVAFSDDLASSKGTRDMVTISKDAGVPVYVVGRPN